MVNRITELFAKNPQGLLSIYFTAGYPELSSTLTLAKQLQDAGVDFIEIGFPFSDPVADGPVIQHTSHEALANGMTLHLLFEQLKALRAEITIPVVLMGYLNPAMQYGMEAFCISCKQVGIDALIMPDLPMEEYENHYQSLFATYGLSNIFLITPQSAEKRINRVDALSNGFIYALSSSSITGKTAAIDNGETTAYLQRLQKMSLANPIMVGFGIHDKSSFQQACAYSAGAIVGSAFLRALDKGMAPIDFVNSLKG